MSNYFFPQNRIILGLWFICFIIVFVIHYWHLPQKLHHSKGQPDMFKLTDSLEEDQQIPKGIPFHGNLSLIDHISHINMCIFFYNVIIFILIQNSHFTVYMDAKWINPIKTHASIELSIRIILMVNLFRVLFGFILQFYLICIKVTMATGCFILSFGYWFC